MVNAVNAVAADQEQLGSSTEQQLKAVQASQAHQSPDRSGRWCRTGRPERTGQSGCPGRTAPGQLCLCLWCCGWRCGCHGAHRQSCWGWSHQSCPWQPSSGGSLRCLQSQGAAPERWPCSAQGGWAELLCSSCSAASVLDSSVCARLRFRRTKAGSAGKIDSW